MLVPGGQTYVPALMAGTGHPPILTADGTVVLRDYAAQASVMRKLDQALVEDMSTRGGTEH